MRVDAMTSSHPAPGPHKPAELFRADLISAMKLPDSMPLESGSFLTIKEPWRTEWEIGVQVCVSPDHILQASTRTIDDSPVFSEDFECSPRYIHEDEDNDYVMYDLDELDLNWLESVNGKRKFRVLAGPKGLDEDTLRDALLTLETKCQQSMARAVATEETLGIEYDEQTTCDVCRDHESEDTNDMIFCDSCNVCVHQACYGVATIPKGEWLCRVCAAGDEQAKCVLCPVKGGALKRVRPGNSSWAHLCCALWIPEVRVGNADKMEPITNIDGIPPSRRNLVCCICRRRYGACIQCSDHSCVTAYHVTCGFQHALDMKSRLDMATTAVIHESYCPKHTAMRKSPSRHGYRSPYKNHIDRPSQLVQLQESFYNYASTEDLMTKLNLSHKLSTLIYNYWKLKRKFQHNRPLLSHLPIETSLESIKAELAAGGIKYGMDVDENFLKIIHLRQNLEKARNLVYMVQRRERLKKQLLQMEMEGLDLKASVAETQTVATPTTSETTAQDRLSSGAESSSDVEVDVPSPRQTRSMTHRGRSSTSPLPSPTVPTLNNIDHHHNHLPSQPSSRVVIMNGPTSPRHNLFGRLKPDDARTVHEDSVNDRSLRRREPRTGTKIEASNNTHSVNPGLHPDCNNVLRMKKINSISKSLGSNGGELCGRGSYGSNGTGLKTAMNGSLMKNDLDSNAAHSFSGVNHRGGSDLSGGVTKLPIAGDGHVLRNRTGPGLRTRPYSVNHKSSKSSS